MSKEEKVGDGWPVGVWERDTVNEGVVAADENGGVAKLELAVEDGGVVICVVIIGSRLSGESHAGEWAKLGGDGSFDGLVELDEVFGDGDSTHLEDFEDCGFTALRLIESGVVICESGTGGEELLAPGGQLMGGFSCMDIEMGGAVLVVKVTLVLLDGSEDEDDGVMEEGESLAGFPRSEE